MPNLKMTLTWNISHTHTHTHQISSLRPPHTLNKTYFHYFLLFPSLLPSICGMCKLERQGGGWRPGSRSIRMHARRENLKVCQRRACMDSPSPNHVGRDLNGWWARNGGNCIWKRCCISNLYLSVSASIIRQDQPDCWFSTLKAMLWVRHVASLLSRLCSEWDVAFLLLGICSEWDTLPLYSRLCSEWDTLPLYTHGYALSETRCLSILKAMLWVIHIAFLLSRLCTE